MASAPAAPATPQTFGRVRSCSESGRPEQPERPATRSPARPCPAPGPRPPRRPSPVLAARRSGRGRVLRLPPPRWGGRLAPGRPAISARGTGPPAAASPPAALRPSPAGPPRERAEQQVLGDPRDPGSVGAASSSSRAATFPGSSLCFLTPGVPFMSGQFTLEPGDE